MRLAESNAGSTFAGRLAASKLVPTSDRQLRIKDLRESQLPGYFARASLFFIARISKTR